MIKVSLKENTFSFTPKGKEMFDALVELVLYNEYKIIYIYDNIPTGRITFDKKNKICKIQINKKYTNIQKEIAILHELLHAKQILSDIPVRNFSTEIQYRELAEYYEKIQGFILDIPINKQLLNKGYDLTLITKPSLNALQIFYSNTNIKPILIQQKTYPLYVAGLNFAYSVEAYNKLMNIILGKDKQQYDVITKLNLLLVKFSDNSITYPSCFQIIVQILDERI